MRPTSQLPPSICPHTEEGRPERGYVDVMWMCSHVIKGSVGKNERKAWPESGSHETVHLHLMLMCRLWDVYVYMEARRSGRLSGLSFVSQARILTNMYTLMKCAL